MRENAQYVVVECVDDLPGFPRYGFATVTHAEELGPNVRWLQTCTSLDIAIEATRELNQRNASTQRID